MSLTGPIPPLVFTSTGPQPQAPASLLAQEIAIVAAAQPGYTVLPGSLIDDVSGTDVAAISLSDQASVDAINSITPFSANPFVLNQLGQIYGVPVGATTNTSVYVVFTGTVGFILQPGFTVSDGTNQYTVADGGIVGSGGFTVPLFCVATVPGAFAVPANTVTVFITSVPTGYTLTCTNPLPGTPSAAPQTEEGYRADVLQAGAATSTGAQTLAKTALRNVPGVQNRLVAIKQITGGWEIIVGGTGDPYAIAYAIYASGLNVSTLVGSTIVVSGYTNANPGVVTTSLNHGLTTGQTATVAGATPSGFNYTGVVTVISETTFSMALNTSGFGAYVSGGVVTPNARNQSISIYDYPDTYTVPFVLPPLQTVTVSLTWNTTATNIVSASAVAQLGAQGIAGYINSIAVGQPINLFELQNAFQLAVASIIPTPLLTRMVFTVFINGISTAPASGTGVIAGDAESYFSTSSASITITQG